jgi:hypothetical protein
MKSLASLLCLLVVFVLVGCDSNPDGPAAPSSPPPGGVTPTATAEQDKGKADTKIKGGRKVGNPMPAPAN